MKQITVFVIIFPFFLGCSLVQLHKKRLPVTSKAKVVILHNYRGFSDHGRWATYGRLLSYAKKSMAGIENKDDWLFKGDLFARKMLAKQKNSKAKSIYLREILPKIVTAGFLFEHVLLDFNGGVGGKQGTVSWKRKQAYQAWKRTQFSCFYAETFAGFRIEGQIYRRIPNTSHRCSS